MILSHLRAAVLAAFPGLDAPKKAFFRIATLAAGRLNLQPVTASADQTYDLKAIEVCPGVPGVTSDPTPGETCIVMFVGKDEVPYVIARASEQMPGHTPAEVRHDAATAIRLISKAASSGAKVYVGAAPTQPVAMGNKVEAIKAALVTFAGALNVAADLNAVKAAGGALNAALGAITDISSVNLEAK